MTGIFEHWGVWPYWPFLATPMARGGLPISASTTVLTGLEFASWPGLSKSLYICTVAFLPGARRAGEMRKLSRTQSKPSQMIPELMQTQSCLYKTTVVIARHQNFV